ncbi:MAG: ankyrin repeat domain-containing protein [Bdellovibrionales bacterium]
MHPFQVIILFVFLFTGVFAKADVTLDFHKWLLAIEQPKYQNIDPEKAKEFVAKGADIHALGPTGGNAVSVAIESWAYASTDPVKAPKIFEIVKYLVDLGGDVSPADYRGLSPLYVVLRYGANIPSAKPMFELLLSKNPDLNVLSKEIGNYAGWGLIHLLATGNREADLFRLLDLGLKQTTITGFGMHFAHRAATKLPEVGQELFLKRLMDRLSLAEQKRFAGLPMKNGVTPLHEAAQKKNIAAVKYLVETFSVNVNARSDAGDTALSLARENQDQPTIDYLLRRGARDIVLSTENRCHAQNVGPLNFERLTKLIHDCGVESVDELLPLLPINFISNYTLAYATQAAIDASPDYPQTIIYGRDGKLMITFNGHKTQKGFNNLELMQFRDETKTFEFRDIHFANDGKVTVSNANPPKCLGCHGTSPRPLWDNWVFWPGKFQGEMESQFPAEKPYYQRYLKNKHKGRYQHLPAFDTQPVTGLFGKQAFIFGQNIKMDFFTENLMTESITRKLSTNVTLRPFRYAALAALSCSEMSIEEFIPEERRSRFLLPYQYLMADTIKKSSEELANRMQLLEAFTPGAPQGRYVLQGKFGITNYYDQAGRNFDIQRTVQLRYVVENNMVDMSDWFTPFNFNKPSYVPNFSNRGLENYVWTELLDPQMDASLYKKFLDARKPLLGMGAPPNLFYKSANQKNVCEELKAKSLASLL